MNKKMLAIFCIAALLAAATYVVAQADKPAVKDDPRIDKLLDQNSQILQKQDDILKKLDDLNTGIAQLRRRST